MPTIVPSCGLTASAHLVCSGGSWYLRCVRRRRGSGQGESVPRGRWEAVVQEMLAAIVGASRDGTPGGGVGVGANGAQAAAEVALADKGCEVARVLEEVSQRALRRLDVEVLLLLLSAFHVPDAEQVVACATAATDV